LGESSILRAVGSTLEGTEDSVTGRGSSETDIEVGLERSGLVVADWLSVG
jgi:hypothetical protein